MCENYLSPIVSGVFARCRESGVCAGGEVLTWGRWLSSASLVAGTWRTATRVSVPAGSCSRSLQSHLALVRPSHIDTWMIKNGASIGSRSGTSLELLLDSSV